MVPSMKLSQIVKSPSRIIFRGQRRRKSPKHARAINRTMDKAKAVHIISGWFLEYTDTFDTNTKRAMNPTVTVNWAIKIAYTFLWSILIKVFFR